MKKILEFSFDSKKYNTEKVMKHFGKFENTVASLREGLLTVQVLSEEVDPSDKQYSEELRKEIEDAMAPFQAKNGEEDKKDADKLLVSFASDDIENIKKINTKGIELSQTKPSTVEVKSSDFSAFVKLCLENKIKIVSIER